MDHRSHLLIKQIEEFFRSYKDLDKNKDFIKPKRLEEIVNKEIILLIADNTLNRFHILLDAKSLSGVAKYDGEERVTFYKGKLISGHYRKRDRRIHLEDEYEIKDVSVSNKYLETNRVYLINKS